MLTPDDLLKTFAGLEMLGLRRPEAQDTPEKLRAAARVYADTLAAAVPSTATLAEAVRGHLRDPERGRFWPTPADLLAALGVRPTPRAGAYPLAFPARRALTATLGADDEALVHRAAVATLGAGGVYTDESDTDTLREIRRILVERGRTAVEELCRDAEALVADDRAAAPVVPSPELPPGAYDPASPPGWDFTATESAYADPGAA